MLEGVRLTGVGKHLHMVAHGWKAGHCRVYPERENYFHRNHSEVRGDEIEAALRTLLGPAAAAPGLVITVRRHDEYELLIERIQALEKEQEHLKQQLCQMSLYPQLYLVALDELRDARKRLKKLGVDTSFITSLRR